MARITLKQIAERAGLSTAAVSMVLNSKQYHRVSPETRRKVEAVARELDYRPNFQAQSLAKGRTGNIAVTLNSMTPFYQEYVRLLTRLADELGYNLFSFETYADPEREEKVSGIINQGLFDGCIVLEYNDLNRHIYSAPGYRVPTVLRGWSNLADPPPNLLRINYTASIRKLFAHLEEEGRRRLAIIIDAGPEEGKEGDPVRPAIYRDLLAGSRLSIADRNWITLPSLPDSNGNSYLDYAWLRTVEILRNDPAIDAIIVQSAFEIPAVYKAAAACGRVIGADLGVATFDRVPILRYMAPEVTHIHEPVEEIAWLLIRKLKKAIEESESIAFGREIDTTLSICASSRREEIPSTPPTNGRNIQ